MPSAGPAPGIISATDLLAKSFPAPRWAVEDVIAEGLTLLAGAPKLGKSWLVLGVGVAVAAGGVAIGRIPITAGDVLYLALEDTQRRLADRLRAILQDAPAPERLHIATEWPRLGLGAESALDAWLTQHPDARLIAIDTLARLRPPASGNGHMYADDYGALVPLKQVADRHGVALVVVHHTRKMVAEDPLDMVSGTTGLAGAADAVLVMKREPGRADATLYLRGRDVPEADHALTFDPVTCCWTLAGDATEFRRSEERADVLKVLRDLGQPMTPKDLADALDKPAGTMRVMLHRMAQAGEVVAREGRYTPATPSNGNAGNPVTPPDGVSVTPPTAEPVTLRLPETPVDTGNTAPPLQGLQGLRGGKHLNGKPTPLMSDDGNPVCLDCGGPAPADLEHRCLACRDVIAPEPDTTEPTRPCRKCGGTGQITMSMNSTTRQEPCPACDGSGAVVARERGQLDGGTAVIVQHCAVMGRMETPVRSFRVGEAEPDAQYPTSVSVWFVEPRKRRRAYVTMRPESIRYLTIESAGRVLYDSRADVPCDMDKWDETNRRFQNNRGFTILKMGAD